MSDQRHITSNCAGRTSDQGYTGGSSTAPAPSCSNGLAVTALVTGIIALLLSWIPGINLLAAVLAVVALVTGFLGMRNAGRPGIGGKGMAITGLVTGALAILLMILVYASLAALFNDPDVRQQLEELQSEVGQTPGG